MDGHRHMFLNRSRVVSSCKRRFRNGWFVVYYDEIIIISLLRWVGMVKVDDRR